MVEQNFNTVESKKNFANFVVHVQFCQNATWQGKIVWAAEQQTAHFRSELELLKLMDSALRQSDERTE